jgi:hypothetical protein
MAESKYMQLQRELVAANAKFTKCGLRFMIGNEVAYRRWLQRYVFERTGLDWRTVQAELRREFLDTFHHVYRSETGRDFPLKPDDPRSEFLTLLAASAINRALQFNPLL